MNNEELKKALYSACMNFVSARIANISEAIASAVESANNETKSSAGDKHETGRAMLQLEQEKNVKQLHEAGLLKEQLHAINLDAAPGKVIPGSVVITNKGNFFIAVSAGKVELNGHIYYCISKNSPIGEQLLNKASGFRFSFNNQEYFIKEII